MDKKLYFNFTITESYASITSKTKQSTVSLYVCLFVSYSYWRSSISWTVHTQARKHYLRGRTHLLSYTNRGIDQTDTAAAAAAVAARLESGRQQQKQQQ